MTSIVYKIVSKRGECRRFDEGGVANVSVKVLGCDGGILTVGGVSTRLTGGAARLNLSRLADGDYTPTLTEDGKLLRLDGISKCGNKLTRMAPDGEIIPRMLMRIEALEEKYAKLEERLSKTEEKTNGHTLFG